jgi:dihydrofolate reductase
MITIIAARAANGVIGKKNELPWYIPEDLAHFKTLTAGHPVIMGKNTYESIVARLHKPLPGRAHFVLTRDPASFSVPMEFQNQVTACSSFDEAVQKAKALDSEVFIIGGEKVFAEGLNKAEKLELTEVHAEHDGDVYFPKFDEATWQKNAEENHDGFSFVTYLRK